MQRDVRSWIYSYTHTHTQKLRSSAEGILDFYLSIFSTDDDFVLTRVRHFCFRTTLQGEIQYSFNRQEGDNRFEVCEKQS